MSEVLEVADLILTEIPKGSLVKSGRISICTDEEVTVYVLNVYTAEVDDHYDYNESLHSAKKRFGHDYYTGAKWQYEK